MGLFSNNKKLCPVCGKPTPRLLATKVEDMPICKDCGRKIDLPKGLVDKMTLDKFSKYISYHDQQQPLRDKFTETYRFDFGFGKGTFVMDASHGFFKLKDDENALIMEISNFKSLRVLEDDKPLYESQGGTIKCYKSMMPSKIRAMSTQITQYEAQRREYEMVEQMERCGMNGTAFMMSETVGLAAEDWMSETVGWMIGDLTSVPRELTAVNRLLM